MPNCSSTSPPVGADLLARTMALTMDKRCAPRWLRGAVRNAPRSTVSAIAIEFLPWSAILDLATAWQLVQESGAANGGIVIDMLHRQRQPGGPTWSCCGRSPAIASPTCRCATPRPARRAPMTT